MLGDNTANVFICSVCGNKFENEQQYFGHLQIHSGEVLWKCTQCDNPNVSFTSQSKLQAHENLYHNLVKPFKCSECDLVFNRASQLDYHTRSVHLNEKSQMCQICGKGFFRKADLKTHLNVHLGTNISICEICGREFNHVSNLIRHCRTHAGLKPYPCSICGKRFTQISSLARHKNIHERMVENTTISAAEEVTEKNDDKKRIMKRRHYCKTCGESFQFVVLLRQHEKLHVKKIKTFQCKNCFQVFQTQDSLQRHDCSAISINQHCDKILKNIENKEKIIDDENVIEKKLENSPEKIVYVNIDQSDANIELQSQEMLNPGLRELSRKINLIGVDSDRDESINISDILSPYNCDDIEFSNSDPIDRDDCSGIPKKLMQSELALSKELHNKCLHIESSQLFIEVCESDYLKSLGLHTLEFQENGNVAFLQENFNITGIDRANPLGDTIDNFNNESPKKYQGLESNGSTLRLVQTHSGEHFYELAINHFTEKNLEQSKNPSTNPSSDSVELCLIDEHVHDQWNSQFSHARNDLIDFTGHSTSEKEGEPSVNLELDQSKNVHVTLMENFPAHLMEQNSETINTDKEIVNNTIDHIQTPMVRLVQNEEGEQFFELIRDHVEFDDNKETKSTQDQDCTSNKNNTESQTNPDVLPPKKYTKQKVPREKSCIKEWKQKFECNECNKQFSSASNLKQHIGTHFFDQQMFQCKDCGLSFAWKSTLNKHIASNHRPDGPQKFVCKICPKVYNTLSQVNEHVKRDHLKERNHVCSECGKCFFKKFDLKSHIRTHTNERPYICQACGKGFYHQSHIIRHERIHSGERPYSCDYCQKTFTQPASLRAHKKRHQEMTKVDILDYRIDEDDPIAQSAF